MTGNIQFGKLPPQAIEVEAAIIGTLMYDKDAIEEIIELLKPDDFYKEVHQIIYRSILFLKTSKSPIDTITICNYLRSIGKLDEVGGSYAVSKFEYNVECSINPRAYALIVSEKAIRRGIIQNAIVSMNNAYDDTVDCFETLSSTQNALRELEPAGEKQQSNIDAFNEIMDDAIAAKQNNGITGLETGLPSLDRLIDGLHPANIIIGARPSIGKSALLKSIIVNLIDRGIKVKLFSLEVKKKAVITNILAAKFEVNSADIKRGDVDISIWDKFGDYTRNVIDKYLDIDDKSGITIQYMESRIKKAKEWGAQLIGIDYIQLMKVNKSDVPPSNREQQISFISNNLARMKGDYNIPFLQLCQLSRQVEERKDKKPQLSDLRESGSLEQDAETVILIHRPEFYGIKETTKGKSLIGKAQLLIAKNRNGSLGTVYCNYIKEQTKFTEESQSTTTLPAEEDSPF